MYGLDVHKAGNWRFIGDFASLEDALAYLAEQFPSKPHAHVWHNGKCVWDSHAGEPEP